MADTKPVVEEKKENFLTRVKNPLFLLAITGFIYTVYTRLAEANGWPTIEPGDFQLAVDLIAYLFIGTGVYSTFGVNKK